MVDRLLGSGIRRRVPYGQPLAEPSSGALELQSNPMASAANHGRNETILPTGWGKDYDVNSGRSITTRNRWTTTLEPPPGSVGGSAGKGGIETTSMVPQILQSHVRSGTVLPADWGKDIDADGNKYYYHMSNGRTSWEAPPGSTGRSGC